ncbi:MAG: hypothetical protein JWM84_2566 [Nocardioides sp.]|nr:hypothetical protein [Nocardioides sp.]
MRRLVPALLACLALSACTGSEDDAAPSPGSSSASSRTSSPAPDVAWEQVALPPPDGPAGRIAVREAVECDGTWWLVGGVFVGDGSVPAGWRSDDDGRTWTPLRFEARGYWAERAVMSSVDCRGDRVVMVGAKSGGAHGNPRVTTWYQRRDGAFTDVIAPFSLFGGDQAVSVERVAAGPDSWLIAGNRTAGAAVWVAEDERTFELVDDDPALVRDEVVDTLAIAQVHDGAGWTVVGSGQVEGRVNRVPMAWVSPDGRAWARQAVPTSDGFTDLERVARTDDGLLAVGLRDDRFGTWRRDGTTWTAAESFGRLDPDGQAFTGAASLATAGDRALAAVSDGTAYALWGRLGEDDWRQVEIPVSPTAAGEHVLTVGATEETVLLVGDDGRTGRVWRAAWPT